MFSLKQVAENSLEFIRAVKDRVMQAAASLVSKAESCSEADISTRTGDACRVLRGQKTELQIAQEMLKSYVFNPDTRVSTFTRPAGVTDVEAMRALNSYFRSQLPSCGRDAVSEQALQWFENSNNCRPRDLLNDTQTTITVVVEGTKGENRTTQGNVLRESGLVFSDPRDGAMAAALHACTYGGKDLFEDCWVNCSVPGSVLYTCADRGVCVTESSPWHDDNHIVALGSP
jgi:hypothetical protein